MIDMTLAWESAQSRGVLQVGKVVSAVKVESHVHTGWCGRYVSDS